MSGNSVLGVFGGVAAGRLENAAKGAKTEARTAGHHAEMAEIAADNATAAANAANRNAFIAAENANVAAINAGVAVEEGRQQAQEILSQLAKGVKEYILPAITESTAKNAADIAALTDLVKELHARLDKLQTQINKQG